MNTGAGASQSANAAGAAVPHAGGSAFNSRLAGCGYGSPKAVKLPDDPVSLLNYYVGKNCLPPARFELVSTSGKYSIKACFAAWKA